MGLVKYKTGGYPIIEKVEVERESKSSVWVGNGCFRKRGGYYEFFDSPQEAAEAIIFKAEKRVDDCKMRVQSAIKTLETANRLLEKYRGHLKDLIKS